VQEKFKGLIVDLIITSTWKDKIVPHIKDDAQNMNSLKIYLALYHEAVIMNILEVFMFHRTAVDESGELLIEIIDYCYKKISKQIGRSMKERKER
jgi:zinc finger MYND domain-containing protein 10